MEAVATAAVVPAARPGRRVKLGWAVFAVTCAVFVAALALDAATGTYKAFPYLAANAVLALIGALADDASTRASDLLGSGDHGPLGNGRRPLLCVRRGGTRGRPWFFAGWSGGSLVRQLVVAAGFGPAAGCAAGPDAGRPPRVQAVVARPGCRCRRDATRVGCRVDFSDVRPRHCCADREPVRTCRRQRDRRPSGSSV